MAEKLKKISLKQQIYLETIYDLSQKEGHAHVKTIAEKLSISMPSVSEAVQKLAEKKLINHDVRKNVSLSEEGKKIAEELDNRHRILADFFTKSLAYTTTKAQKLACQVEHVVDADFCERLASFSKSKGD